VTDRFGSVTAEFENVTSYFGNIERAVAWGAEEAARLGND